jgi:hypothetical protein
MTSQSNMNTNRGTDYTGKDAMGKKRRATDKLHLPQIGTNVRDKSNDPKNNSQQFKNSQILPKKTVNKSIFDLI